MSQARKLVAGRSLRWNDECAAEAYSRGLWVRTTLADVLRQAAEQTPDRLLLIDGANRIDCQTLYRQASALAQVMLRKAPTGSVVSFMLPNWYEAAVVYLGATLAGMAVNPILPSLRDHELAFILKDVDTRLIFIPSSIRQFDYAAMMSRVTAQMAAPPQVVVVRGDAGQHTPYEIFLKTPVETMPWPAQDAEAIRMVMYTSGTTGRPKGVLHSHNSIHALISQLRDNWLIEPGDKFLVPSPIAHIGGSIYAFESPLLLGTTAVLMERWNADDAVRLMDAEGCTHMAGATPFLEQLLAAAQRAATRVPSLKVFICGGASVPPALVRSAAAYFERALVSRVYGSTEVPVTTVGVMQRDDAAHAADTDGCRGLAEIRLLNHNAAPAGEGEICARGPQMLMGYLHAEDEKDAFDADGFYRSGDVGRWVDGRYLMVTGRAKDIIIRNGENISPKEIEDMLLRHPDIAEIAIVGLPDPRTGERACAVIVPSRLPGPDVASLRSFLDGLGIATFKVPEQVVIWETLPKNDAGKVLKHQIRATLAAPKR
jgi:acyl-CoA synthetase (AMP-forming)/AMP-acid ligase II